MSNSSPSRPNYDNLDPSDDAHEDLMATLAAARELNPEMDKALAEQYLARRKEQQRQKAAQAAQNTPAIVPQGQRNMAAGWWGFPVLPSFGALFLIVLLITSIVTGRDGLFWSLFWVPLAFGWWGWGHRGPRSDYRYQRRLAHDHYRQERWEAHHGYLPSDDPYTNEQSPSPRRPTIDNF